MGLMEFEHDLFEFEERFVGKDDVFREEGDGRWARRKRWVVFSPEFGEEEVDGEEGEEEDDGEVSFHC